MAESKHFVFQWLVGETQISLQMFVFQREQIRFQFQFVDFDLKFRSRMEKGRFGVDPSLRLRLPIFDINDSQFKKERLIEQK